MDRDTKLSGLPPIADNTTAHVLTLSTLIADLLQLFFPATK
jgi:hypothetical protein